MEQENRPSFEPPYKKGELGYQPSHGELQQSEPGRELLGFIERAEDMQSDLADAEAKQPGEFDEQSLPIEPTLRERYTSAELLMRGVKQILKDEIGGANPLARDASYLREKIGAALSPFGLKVVIEEDGRRERAQMRARRRLRRVAKTGVAERRIEDDGTRRSLMGDQADGGTDTRR